MAQPATILIPDISGYTNFVTKTEIEHSTHIINELLDVLLNANGDKFTLAEIEGDALLLFRDESKTDVDEIVKHCEKMFRDFHTYLKEIENNRVCVCGACQQASNLTVKFVVHHGQINHIRVGPISKPTGANLIVAHRLLKNSLGERSYLLVTRQVFEATEKKTNGKWHKASETYPALGEVDYKYTSMQHLLEEIPDPPDLEKIELVPAKKYAMIEIDAPLKEVYKVMIDPEAKVKYIGALKDIVVEDSLERVGSRHVCFYGDFTLDFELLPPEQKPERFLHVERFTIREMEGLEVYNYNELIPKGENSTCVRSTVAHEPGKSLPDELVDMIAEAREGDVVRLKNLCEKGEI